MVKKIKILALILLSQLNTHCQMKQQTSEFHVDISHPDKKYRVTPVFDYIKTLEGTPAGFPYGSTSGSWASSGSSWTAQKGTPIGFETTYFAWSENKYYHIDQNFDKDYILEMTNRCYSWQDEYSELPVEEFISKEKYYEKYDDLQDFYYPFSTLVFGFAPQGMVVVWMSYGGSNKVELGRFQAKEVTDEKRLEECKKKLLSTYRIHPESYNEIIEMMKSPNTSCQLWDNYRIKYNWNYKVTSDNHGFRFLCFGSEYFNGESEKTLRPIVLNPIIKKRAIPSFIMLCWETSNKERYLSRVFFNWEKTNELLKNAGENNTFQFHINKQNSEIEVLLSNNPIEVDSVRIYPSHLRFRDSYTD